MAKNKVRLSFAVSAKTGHNVDEAFLKLAEPLLMSEHLVEKSAIPLVIDAEPPADQGCC
jgi:hypothetical protein